MVQELIRCDYDPIVLAERGGFHVESLEINSIRAADMEAMAKIAEALGKPTESARWFGRVDAMREGFRSKMIGEVIIPVAPQALKDEPVETGPNISAPIIRRRKLG